MKSKSLIIALIFISVIFITSCEKDDNNPAKPEITITELGHENSKIAYAGSDLHIEAEIVAEAKIEKITIEIHPEGDHEKSSFYKKFDFVWEVDTTYTGFSGLKNTTFHKHIEIPMEADSGLYHFHFIVTDKEGQQTTLEEEIEIQRIEDVVAPVITITAAPANNQSFSNGSSISISGTLSDDKALGGLYIGLVREDQNLTDAEVNDSNTITLLHVDDFENEPAYSFASSIVVGAANDNNIEPKSITGNIAWQSANYYIVVKCKDAFGANWTISGHYPIIINL